jgi:2-haloacid dehalogenase
MSRPTIRGTIDYGQFDVLTFDCYGTLIDWEAGIAASLRAALPDLSRVSDDELLEQYARHEAEAERPPYRSYREVLGTGLRRIAEERGLTASPGALESFMRSVPDWPAFPDSSEALRRLHERFRLGVITNCDDDLFDGSARRLGVAFDWVVTAQQAHAYKPSPEPFTTAFEMIAVPRERILHVAQSLFHDHVPARELGLTSVWIDRRHGKPGFGATPPAAADPAAVFPSMAAFADDAVPAR